MRILPLQQIYLLEVIEVTEWRYFYKRNFMKATVQLMKIYLQKHDLRLCLHLTYLDISSTRYLKQILLSLQLHFIFSQKNIWYLENIFIGLESVTY